MSVGAYFSDDQWNVASLALHRACDITLTPLRQLMMAFTAGSHSFYGDSNQVYQPRCGLFGGKIGCGF